MHQKCVDFVDKPCHDTFVYYSGLGRVQDTKNETMALQNPRQVSKPKYEATALQAHSNIGYPNFTNGQYVHIKPKLPNGSSSPLQDTIGSQNSQ